MSQNSETSGFSPGNFLWAVLSLGIVLSSAFLFTNRTPETNVEDLRGERRLEARKKLNADEAATLSKLEWADKNAGTVKVPVSAVASTIAKELTAKKPAPSAIKVEAPLVIPAGDTPAMPSAPSGAVNIHFTSLVVPSAPAPAPAPGN